MSGLHPGSSFGLSTPAAGALETGATWGRQPRGSLLALCLSGATHAAVLALLLALQIWTVVEEPPEIEIRLHPMPRPTFVDRLVPAAAPGARRTVTPGGSFVPVAQQDPRDFIRHLPDGPITALPNDRSDGPAERGQPREGVDVAASALSNPDEPSEYQEPPVPIFAPEPGYPDMAFAAGIEGTVLLEAIVTREGLVRQLRVQQGNPILAAAAIAAVQTWRFRPARWNGKPVTVRIALPVKFTLG